MELATATGPDDPAPLAPARCPRPPRYPACGDARRLRRLAHQRLPAPFGPAANGSIVYSKDGDILARDAIDGTTRPLIATAETELADSLLAVGDAVSSFARSARSLDFCAATIDGQDRGPPPRRPVSQRGRHRLVARRVLDPRRRLEVDGLSHRFSIVRGGRLRGRGRLDLGMPAESPRLAAARRTAVVVPRSGRWQLGAVPGRMRSAPRRPGAGHARSHGAAVRGPGAGSGRRLASSHSIDSCRHPATATANRYPDPCRTDRRRRRRHRAADVRVQRQVGRGDGRPMAARWKADRVHATRRARTDTCRSPIPSRAHGPVTSRSATVTDGIGECAVHGRAGRSDLRWSTSGRTSTDWQVDVETGAAAKVDIGGEDLVFIQRRAP